MINSLRRWVERSQLRVLPSGSMRARLATGTLWSLIGAIIAQGLALLASVITARLLGREGFGELGIINSTAGMFGVFAGFGLGTMATKYVAELRVLDPGRAGRILGLSIWTALVSGGLVSFVLLLVAQPLASQTLNAPHLADELGLGALLLFFNAIAGAQTGALSGFEAFRAIARVNLVRGLLNFPLMVAGVWLFGLMGAVGAMALAAAVGCALNEWALRQECRRANISVSYRGAMSEWRVLWDFSFPAFLSGAMYGPITWAANALLVNQPGGYSEMGVFNAANQWRAALIFLPTIMGQALLPILSNLWGEGDTRRYRKALRANLAATFAVSLLVAVPIMVASPLIMPAYGAGFGQGVGVLVLIVLSAVLYSCSGVIGFAIAGAGRMWHGFSLNCIWAVAFGVSVYFFIEAGAYGLAMAYLLSYVVHLISSGLYVALMSARLRA